MTGIVLKLIEVTNFIKCQIRYQIRYDLCQSVVIVSMAIYNFHH
jgi:hypothetical protein